MHRRVNGYLATVTGLKEPVSGWKVRVRSFRAFRSLDTMRCDAMQRGAVRCCVVVACVRGGASFSLARFLCPTRT